MLEHLANDLQGFTFLTVIFRSVMAILIGGILGMERDLQNRAAGLRTHMLVCFGSAVVMMTNQFVVLSFPDANIDPTRMGAQVISGIGFLGAGTILVTNESRIKGLTTAAGLWVSATIGLAIGAGFYSMALVGGIAMLGIVVLLRPLKDLIQEKMDHTEITAVVHVVGNLSHFMDYISSVDLNIVNFEIEHEMQYDYYESKSTIITVTFDLGERMKKDAFIEKLKQVKGVQNVIPMTG